MKYMCEHCGREFKQRNDLKRHINKKNGCISVEQMQQKSGKTNELHSVFKSCLDILRNDAEHLIGDEALYELSHFLILKLSEKHIVDKSIDLYKFNTSSTTPVYNVQVNTSELVSDRQLHNLTGVEHIRNNTIFNYQRPLSQVVEMADKSLAVSWSSGSTPSIYYQQISTSDGSKISTEKQIDKTNNSI